MEGEKQQKADKNVPPNREKETGGQTSTISGHGKKVWGQKLGGLGGRHPEVSH